MDSQNALQSYELTDTGMWRLIAQISASGMQAWLQSVEDPTQKPLRLFDKNWGTCEGADLLHQIENTVYDNPRILDDFSAQIIIHTSSAMWIPQDKTANIEEEQSYFAEIYPELASELMVDEVKGRHCLYALTPGLTPFLQRTFPGARINCHQSIIIDRFAERPNDSADFYCDISEYGIDYYGFQKDELLFSLTTAAEGENNIIYKLFSGMQAYGIDPAETHVYLSGDKDIRQNIANKLRKFVGFAMPTMLPRVGLPKEMPLPVLLSASRLPATSKSHVKRNLL